MRKLSKMICLSAAVLAPLLAAGCSDDENSDNPGGGATSNEGGDGGTNSSGSGGKTNTSGSNNGGKSGSGTGGSSTAGTAGTAMGGESPENGGAGNGPGPAPSACDLDALEDGGAIPVDSDGNISEDTTLESGKTYELGAVIEVLDGATLTVEPCVKILGTKPTAVLGVLPGGKLEAAGTADAPILFTSAKVAGKRAPGDWGGLIILGNAQVNQPDTKIEGLEAATPYGSTTDEHNDESSGTLEYVRVEYVGRDIDGAGNESNGITFGGVGRGTKVSHVMVSNSIDDCFEWFGGTVNADHLIALNCDDDAFDTDFGFSGNVQFAFAKQYEATAEKDSNGFEMDTSNSASIDPLTAAKWANVTLCGANTGTAPADPRIGMVLRRQVSGSIVNAIVTGFDSGAFSVRDIDKDPPTDISLTSSLIFGNLSVNHADTHKASATWFQDQDGNVDDGDDAPAGFDCYSNPPSPIPDESVEGVDPGAGFEKAKYKGAFAGGENWMTGSWVDWSEK